MQKLMEKTRIGSMELKNRIVMAPMGVDLGQDANPATVEYYSARIDGGVGMLLINMLITDYFEDIPSSMVLNEASLPGLTEICRRAHEKGCKVGFQFMPGCGRMGPNGKAYDVPISASACGWLYIPDVPCHEMTLEEIGIMEDYFRKDVEMALQAGADCIELHFYGGYLGDQFLTAAWNTRTDKYGGDVRGRATFPIELLNIAKEVAGRDFPVLIKFCPDHGVPYPGFRQLEEGIELARILEEAGFDALHVDAGCYEKWQLAMPAVFYQEMTLQTHSAKAVKEAVNIPVLTHGRLGDVEKAEAALENGVCDIAVIGRGLLADPELPNKIAEKRPEDIRPCISCNEGCIGSIMRFEHVKCALNPFTGFESERRLVPAETPKKVLVVGGGPAGCASALMAAKIGHRVELWEKSSRVGGKAIAAAAPYMKRDMIRLCNYYNTQLLKSDVTLRLYTEATHETVADFAPDVIIWATGGHILAPKSIPGIDSDNVYPCEKALKNLVPVGRRVVIAGGGQVGIEAALHFDHNGHDVTVIEMADQMMPDPPFQQNENILREMMSESRATYLTSTKVVEITPEGAVVENEEGRQTIPCDTVLLAMGYIPDSAEGESYADICPVIPIGDSVKCRDILNATREAYEAVSRL
ncbi:MAG: FAD-dependent oxidoreductase [Oscillospiraceae bacterium]|nr:FAD-dependent oxidoreductase [Oscillospiraceae bacterium]MBO7373867.1 FAD-dependent oxidoreductase [Oscillospiraceae bacterium]